MDEIVAAMVKTKIPGSRTSWRFYDRHGIAFKKTLYAEEQTRDGVE